jgi:3-carboxy-cis,cis-muconate cycloisomerase
MPSLLDELAGDAEIAALLSDEAQLAAILAFESALAAAEAEVGLISERAATVVAERIARFEPDWNDLRAGMLRDGLIVPSLVKQMRQAIGERHAADLHRGATSQDAVDTALILQLAKVIPVLIDRISKLEATFAALEARDGSRVLMAHTRLQAALPFTVADKIRTWREPLARHRQALSAMRGELLVIQLGGPIGDRSSFDGQGEAVARSLAARLSLGFANPWHSTRDPIVIFGARLAALAGSLGKFGADVALLAQSEVGAITLANSGRSSAMGHKNNPVRAELLVALAHHAAGLGGTLNHAMLHENERSGAAWTLEWLTLPPLVIATGASLRTAEQLLQTVTFNQGIG